MSCKRLQVTVVLNVYDLHEYNGCLYYVGMGVYHCGVELQYDSTTIRQTKEYSYLGNPLTESTGVFNTHPRSTFGAKYRMSMDMGTVYISNQELALILDGLKIEYLAKDYNILTKYGVYTEMSFYDALTEVQSNRNLNRESPMISSKSTSSFSSWLYQKSYLHQDSVGKKRKRTKRKRRRQNNVDSDSEEEDIADFMNYGHSVTVIGLNDSDHRTESDKDDTIVLTNAREAMKMDRMSPSSSSSNGVNSDQGSPAEEEWTMGSYQQLPSKTPSPRVVAAKRT